MAYSHYCQANNIEWDRPALRNEKYPVQVPTEERINMIISSASPRYATIFHLSKYGLRPDEISKITLRDIDLDARARSGGSSISKLVTRLGASSSMPTTIIV